MGKRSQSKGLGGGASHPEADGGWALFKCGVSVTLQGQKRSLQVPHAEICLLCSTQKVLTRRTCPRKCL